MDQWSPYYNEIKKKIQHRRDLNNSSPIQPFDDIKNKNVGSPKVVPANFKQFSLLNKQAKVDSPESKSNKF